MAGNQWSKAANNKRAAAALARRSQISQLRLAGYRDPMQIARQVGVSRSTIKRDFEWIDERYREQAVTDIATLKGKQLERIESAITAIWNDVRQGRWRAIEVLILLLDREAKLMGLDAPRTVQVDIEAEIRTLAIDMGYSEDEGLEIARRVIDIGKR